MDKAHPNKWTINSYLNIEYPSRRNWVRAISSEIRASKFFESYACFKNHHVVRLIYLKLCYDILVSKLAYKLHTVVQMGFGGSYASPVTTFIEYTSFFFF